uniref:Uncharacterized protein n=1 Tax=Salix viminalis TaxID=40686 RepID=A0A6N2M6K6_SALVM
MEVCTICRCLEKQVESHQSSSRVVDGSACSKLSNTDSHLLGSIPADMERKSCYKCYRDGGYLIFRKC